VDPALVIIDGGDFATWLVHYRMARDRIVNILQEDTALLYWRSALHTWYLSVLDRQIPGPQNRGELDTLIELVGRALSSRSSSTLSTYIKNNVKQTEPIIYYIVMLYLHGDSGKDFDDIPPASRTPITDTNLISAALCWFFWFSLRDTEVYDFVFTELLPGWDVDNIKFAREDHRRGEHNFVLDLPPVQAYFSFWSLMRSRFVAPLKELQTSININRQNKERASSSSSSSTAWNVAIKAKPAFNNNVYIQVMQLANDMCNVARGPNNGPVVEFINSIITLRRHMATAVQNLTIMLSFTDGEELSVDGVPVWYRRDAAVSKLLGWIVLDQINDPEARTRLKARLCFLLRQYHNGREVSSDISNFINELWTKYPRIVMVWLLLCDAFLDARQNYVQYYPVPKFQHDRTHPHLFLFGYCPVCGKAYTHCVGEDVGKPKRKGKRRDFHLEDDDDDDEEGKKEEKEKKKEDEYWNPSLGYDGAVIDLVSPLHHRYCARQTARTRSICIFTRLREENLWNKLLHHDGRVYGLCQCCENMCLIRPNRYSTHTGYLCDHCYLLYHTNLKRSLSRNNKEIR
jgi:hypothetical protein